MIVIVRAVGQGPHTSVFSETPARQECVGVIMRRICGTVFVSMPDRKKTCFPAFQPDPTGDGPLVERQTPELEVQDSNPMTVV